MTFWQTFTTAMASQVTLLTGLGFLGRELIQNFLAEDLEAFKAKLTSNAQLVLEEAKHRFVMEAREHQVRFDKRAEAIGDMYTKLVTA
jgi:hypothetical protein